MSLDLSILIAEERAKATERTRCLALVRAALEDARRGPAFSPVVGVLERLLAAMEAP